MSHDPAGKQNHHRPTCRCSPYHRPSADALDLPATLTPSYHDDHQVLGAAGEQQAALGHDPEAGVRAGLPEDDQLRDRAERQPPVHRVLRQRGDGHAAQQERQGVAQGTGGRYGELQVVRAVVVEGVGVGVRGGEGGEVGVTTRG